MLVKSYNAGISLVEVVLALTIFSIVVASLIHVQWGIDSLSQNNIKTLISQNWMNTTFLRMLSGQGIQFGRSVDAVGIEHVVMEWPHTKCLYSLFASSEWRSFHGSTSSVAGNMLFPRLQEGLRLGGDCGGHPKGFVEHTFEFVDSVPVGPVSAVDIYNDIVYVSLASANVGDPDIAFFEKNNVSQVDFLEVGQGINNIDVVGTNVFAAHNSSSAQLISFDDLGSEVFATTSLPGVAGQRPEAVSIFYYDSRVYIGTKRTVGHEFHVFDVSNALAPVWLGSREVNHNINDIEVQDGLAFLATSGNVRDLIILDVSDPTQIVQVATMDLPGSEDGKSVFVSGDLIFLGRHRATAPGRSELHVVRFVKEDLFALSHVASASVGGDVYGLVYANGFIYTATSNSQKELQIFGFSQNNYGIVPSASFDLPDIAKSIDVESDLLVVSAGDNVYLYEQK